MCFERISKSCFFAVKNSIPDFAEYGFRKIPQESGSESFCIVLLIFYYREGGLRLRKAKKRETCLVHTKIGISSNYNIKQGLVSLIVAIFQLMVGI